jgi:N-acetylglucosaminyl-diphospho-decaprenol L-rhamnosyltransferase
MKLSFIIVTYNSADYIGDCLNSIVWQQPIDITSEFILIDNASTDSTVEILKNKFPDILLKEKRENVGFAAAVNQAVYLSQGEYILLLNPDTIIKGSFIEKLFSFLHNTPDASIVGVKLVDENYKHHPSAWKKKSLLSILLEMLLPYAISIKLVTKSPKTPMQVDNVSGACMLIRRDVFEKLNGFDTRFFLYYEEIDFCMRANKKGYKVYYNPEIEVVHFAAKSSSNDKEAFFYNLYHSKLLCVKKHFSYPFYLTTYLLVIVGILLRIFVSFIAGLVTFRRRLLRLSKSLIFVLIKIIKSRQC